MRGTLISRRGSMAKPSTPPAIDPLTVSGLRAAYIASEAGVADGALMSTWPGHGHDASAVGALRPTYRATGAAGKPGVEFSGGQVMSAALGAIGTPMTVFGAVIVNNPSFVYIWHLNWGGGVGGQIGMSRYQTAATLDGRKAYTYDGATASLDGVLNDGVRYVLTSRHDPSAPRNNFWRDGAAQTITDYAGSISTAGALKIGAADGAALLGLIGFITHLFIYDVGLSDANRQGIENYLIAA
jgi:hypothetical protein